MAVSISIQGTNVDATIVTEGVKLNTGLWAYGYLVEPFACAVSPREAVLHTSGYVGVVSYAGRSLQILVFGPEYLAHSTAEMPLN